METLILIFGMVTLLCVTGVAALLLYLFIKNKSSDIGGDMYVGMLISTLLYEQEYDGLIIDFSAYDEYQVISSTTCFKRSPQTEEEKQINGVPVLIPRAIVYEIEKGAYVWESLL